MSRYEFDENEFYNHAVLCVLTCGAGSGRCFLEIREEKSKKMACFGVFRHGLCSGLGSIEYIRRIVQVRSGGQEFDNIGFFNVAK